MPRTVITKGQSICTVRFTHYWSGSTISQPDSDAQGCVNDIDAFATYLSERVAKDKGVVLNLRTLKNGEATRLAVIDTFRDHLGKAAKGDVVLFLLQRPWLARAGPRGVLEIRAGPPRRDARLRR